MLEVVKFLFIAFNGREFSIDRDENPDVQLAPEEWFLQTAARADLLDRNQAAGVGVGVFVILCSIFGHRRSKRWAHRHGEEWRSECVFCGERLVRIGPKRWRTLGSKF